MTSRFRLLLVCAVLLAVVISPGWSYPALSYDNGNNPTAGSSTDFANESTNAVSFAYPTIMGDSGLVNIPTADVIPYFHLNAAVNYAEVGADGGRNSAVLPARLTFGLSQNLELFGTYSEASNVVGYSVYGAGGKLQLINSDTCKGAPDLAIGARMSQFTGTVVDRSLFDLYAVSSMSLLSYGEMTQGGYRLRGHLGVDLAHYSGDTSGDFVRPFAGLSYEYFNGSQLVLDYVPRIVTGGTTLRDSSLSGAVRIPVTSIMKLELGGGRPYAYGNESIYAGLMFHFGDALYDPDQDEKPILSY